MKMSQVAPHCDMCEDIEMEEYHLVTGCDIRCICGRWHRV